MSKETELAAKQKITAQKYRDRLSILRQAQEYSQKDDIPRAVAAYKRYLESLATYFEIDEKKLNPEIFLKTNNQAEILLISQVYWDLAKAYDRSPKLEKECERCLDQFVKFSTGFKFQFINSEMLRKFMMKKNAYNQKIFERAYQKIKVSSKKCYISTFALGNHSPLTTEFRIFKEYLIRFKIGLFIVGRYYNISPKLVFAASQSYFIRTFLYFFSVPLLWLFYFPIIFFNRISNENNKTTHY
jgi:hypothetical protein